MVTFSDLKKAAVGATRKLTVCVPARQIDYYAGAQEWNEERIQYIDADDFLDALAQLEEESER